MSCENRQGIAIPRRLDILSPTTSMASVRSLRRAVALTPVFVCSLLLSHLHGPTLSVHAWGIEGHHIICNIAEKLLNPIAISAVEELLPDSSNGNLSSVCVWADFIRTRKGYEWSAPLHFIDTPNDVCNYNYIRDCRDDVEKPGFCTSGAINNFTDQMSTYSDQYNLTEALMFLAHLVADIHQPLHVGFEGDHGGNSIRVLWYNTKTNLHHVWDTDMIYKTEELLFGGDVSKLTKSLYNKITGVWKAQAEKWSSCGGGEIACPDLYAAESIRAACEWAYTDASDGAALTDDYFKPRAVVLQKRMAQAAVRLASILNKIFPDEYF